MTQWKLGAAALALAALAVSPALAAHHDSNTLSKLGKAIQYPINKTSQNTSVAAHRLVGSKSVMHRRNGNKTYRAVITRNGRVYRKHRVHHKY